jgi:hypothetical protein
LPIEADPSLMYRGMSSGEYEAFKASGKIQTAGSHNIGSAQEGLTYFGADPRMAATYASDFAPWQYKPDFDKPAYVVVARRAGPERLRRVAGTAGHAVDRQRCGSLRSEVRAVIARDPQGPLRQSGLLGRRSSIRWRPQVYNAPRRIRSPNIRGSGATRGGGGEMRPHHGVRSGARGERASRTAEARGEPAITC